MDRISSLPDNITASILLLLPIRDGARTSLLSSSWRNKWRCIPELVFGNEFYQLQSNKGGAVKEHNLFWLDIFRILSLHRGHITSFRFCIDKLKSCPEVDQLFLLLSVKNIQEFTFRIDGRSKYRLPSHLFSYENLRKLVLSDCMFKAPPTFRGFHKLSHLEFHRVRFVCEYFHQDFISHCLLLEHLTMVACEGIDSFVIDFPKLKVLRLDGFFTSFRFERSPLLATVEILKRSSYEPSSNAFTSFFDCLPVVKSLRVNDAFLQFLKTAESQETLPTDIQSLELHDISLGYVKDVSAAMFLIMNCHNLKNLKIKLYHDWEGEFNEVFDYGEFSEYCSEKLTRVEIYNFSGSVQELEFIKFLLNRLASLEVLVTKYLVAPEPKEEVVMLKSVLQLPRFSPKAKIICLDPDT